MKRSFLIIAIFGAALMSSCDKEKTCECTTTYIADDGTQFQPGDTDEKVTEESCDDFDVKELDTPIEGVTTETDCEEK